MEYLPKTENTNVSERSKMTGKRGWQGEKKLRINQNKTAVLAKLINSNRSQNSGHLGGMREGTMSGKGHRGSFWAAGNVPYPYPDGGYPGEEMESCAELDR